MPPVEERPLRLLISFAPADRELKDRLVEHLQVLVRFAGIELWEADRVRAGDNWRQEADAALDRADVALVLISPAYLASDLLQDVEVPKLFQRREQGGLKVIPVLLRSCLSQAHPWLTTLAPLPYSREAIASFEGDRRDQALTEVAAEIAERAGALPARAPQPSSEAGAPEALRPMSGTPAPLRFDTTFKHTAAAAVAVGTSPQASGTMNMPGLTINNPGTVIFAGVAAPQTSAVQPAPPASAPKHTPSYLNAETRLLSEKLVAAQTRKQRLQEHGADTTEVVREILDLKRQLREGGQLKPGDALGDGRYLLLDKVGRGGFATVWKGFDRVARAIVAIKVLHGELVGDSIRRERFFRGARRMAKLSHDAVVRVLEPKGEDGGYHYYVMEFMSGGDFRQAVLTRRLVGEATVPVIVRVGEALALAHGRRWIHRDVKPTNILLDENLSPRLTDFDLVGDPDTTGGTRTGALGSLLYAAPELMCDAREAGPEADVYSLGMTAVFGLHGADLTLGAIRDVSPLINGLPCNKSIKAVLIKAVEWEGTRFLNIRAFCQALRGALLETDMPESSATPTRVFPVRQTPTSGHTPPPLKTSTGAARDPIESSVGEGIYLGHILGKTGHGGGFVLDRLLRDGNWTSIYAAHDVNTGALAAVKIYHGAAGSSAALEAKTASATGSKHFAKVLSVGKVEAKLHGGEMIYVVMEYIEGQSLRDVMNQAEKLSLSRVVPIVFQIAQALMTLHSVGVVHRELSPEKVMLVRKDHEDLVKVIGFGDEAARSRHQRGWAMMGMPAIRVSAMYSSPESLQALPTTDHRADIFSLGVILYELVSGNHPFPGKVRPAVMLSILSQDARPIQEAAPECGSALADLIHKCLSKDPDGRPSTMAKFIEALEQC